MNIKSKLTVAALAAMGVFSVSTVQAAPAVDKDMDRYPADSLSNSGHTVRDECGGGLGKYKDAEADVLVYQKAGEILGDGIFTLITLYNPELVIITGKGVQAGPPLFNHTAPLLAPSFPPTSSPASTSKL